MKKPEFKGPERRYFESSLQIETRAGQALAESRHIVGYALKFNTLSKDLGGFQERIDPKAIDGVDLSDVVALFNHDKNLILARGSSKTLTVTVDKIGLRYEFDAPETTAGNDLLVSIARGDVAGSSFAFTVDYDDECGGTKWEQVGDIVIRNILKFDQIIDVSPVVFPAYAEADVAKRDFEEWRTKTIPPKPFTQLELTKTKLALANA